MFAIGDERKEIIQGVWQRAFFSTLRFCSCIGQYYYSFLKFQLYPELKLCCSYLVNFSPGFSTNFSVSPFCFVEYTITARCPSSRLSTHWNLNAISRGFLSLFFKPEWKFFHFFFVIRPGWELSQCNRKHLFKETCSESQTDLSARLTGLKFGPG